MGPFVVPVTSLLRQPGATTEVSFVAPFDPEGELGALTRGAPEVLPGADVEVLIVLASFQGGIMATGEVAAPWHALCRRCAKEVTGLLRVRVAERFSKAAGPEDEEAYPIVEEQIDLSELVRDAIVLDLPLAPLCSDGCLGLCPVCGTDRNVATCGCEPAVDPRWATLDALRVPDQA
jgi:uncharacterized protein